MRIVLLSDTHGLYEGLTVPAGDVLIFAGDAGRRGPLEELRAFNDFLSRLPHPHKIFVAGNRDYFFQAQPEESREILTSAVYLQDEEVSIGGVRIYGSPWQPPFMDTAFNLPRGEPLREKWALIPAGIDILVTHTPPYGIGDRTARGESVGCEELLAAVRRIKPKLHVFGHIHEGYGRYEENGIIFINACVTDASMQRAHQAILYDY